MRSISKNVSNLSESIFTTMSKLALEHKAINLSQGFPDFDGPEWVKSNVQKYIDQGYNQYAPSVGILSLRKAISKLNEDKYKVIYDPETEVTILNGATEAIFCTIKALVNPGDEVIVFEPFYDSYKASLELAGAKIIPITLKKELNFSFDKLELEKSFNSNTKLIILNSPHNPTGKVFDLDELTFISKLVVKYDSYCLSDEVYEYLTFEKVSHIPISTLSNMKERTIMISSSGKTFGLTGWKIGWASSSKEISHAIRMVHQFSTFSVAHPLQLAIRDALNNIDEYLIKFKKSYQSKRDYFIKNLKEIGYDVFTPYGTYFTMISIPENIEMNDVEFCKNLIVNYKIAAIPASPFYIKSNEGNRLVRFCFAKKEETLSEAILKLRKSLH